jgi:hypothetical protein
MWPGLQPTDAAEWIALVTAGLLWLAVATVLVRRALGARRAPWGAELSPAAQLDHRRALGEVGVVEWAELRQALADEGRSQPASRDLRAAA